MKKILSLTLAAIMLFSLVVPVGAYKTPGLDNFEDINSYAPGMFTDIAEGVWWTENIATAYEKGLMKGNADGSFAPRGSITVTETIVIACRLHHIYNGGDGVFEQGSPWYQVYIDYAIAEGIISEGQFADYKLAATRSEFAEILVKALPSTALKKINSIPDGSIPDVFDDADYYDAVYTLYRAGILTGSDAAGSFKPENSITRAEASAIITRMADPELRKSLSLTVPEISDCITLTLTADGSGYQVTACESDAETVTIPAYHRGLPVKSIAPGIFKNCQKLGAINISGASEYLYSEGGVAFSNSPVKTLVAFPPAYSAAKYYYVPAGVKAIGAYAFAGMNSLESLTIPEGVTTMGNCAFAEVRCQTAVFIPDSLTTIGKHILLDQKSNMPFYTNSWETVFAKYCDTNALTHGVVMPETPKTTTIPTTVPTHQTENLTAASGRVKYTDYWPHASDRKHCNLSEDEQKTDKEVFIELGKVWECDFEATGVYGAGYTKTPATIRAYDKSGKLVGMDQVNGNFAFCFPGAYDFGIEGGTDTGITFVPVQPLYVTGSGSYAIDADKCYSHADGNVFNYLIIMYPRSSMYAEFPYHLNFCSSLFVDTYYPYTYENSEHYMLLELQTRDASRVDKMKAWAFHFGGMKVLVDNSEFMCCVADNLKCTANFGTRAYELFKTQKSFMLGNYYPTSVPIKKISFIADGSYPGALDCKVYLDEYTTENFSYYTLVHETVHAIDQSIEATDFAPDCWMEGRAEYITYKLLDILGVSNYNNYESFSWSYLTQAQKDDFFSYFYYNSDRQTPYPVGYHFIKYISRVYGEDVNAKVMENLANCGHSSWEQDAASAAVFKKCVEDATEPGVFQNFVRDVIGG